jgi:hypothetical protein
VALSKNAVANRCNQFEADLKRALDLYKVLVEQGHTAPPGKAARALRQPDRRDAAQFIFFEIAAKFEAFIQDLFMIEVRKNLSVSPARAVFIMGHPDRGLSGVMGWGAVPQVRDRARNLFGAHGFFAHLETVLGKVPYQRLQLAHTLRNRVAHDTSDARAKYRKALATLQVPKKSRQGAGVGRVLLEYPHRAKANDRWFHRFLEAYRLVATRARTRLK